jgi:hypothetical protein
MVGRRQRVGCKAFDQFNDLKPLPRCKFEEGFQQPQAFDSFARWSSELFVQLCNKCGIFHLAPLIGNGNGISRQT